MIYTACGNNNIKIVSIITQLTFVSTSFFLLNIVNIDGRNYEGQGTSKKQARNEAAQLALQMAFSLELPQAPNSAGLPQDNGDFHFGDFISKFDKTII